MQEKPGTISSSADFPKSISQIRISSRSAEASRTRSPEGAITQLLPQNRIERLSSPILLAARNHTLFSSARVCTINSNCGLVSLVRSPPDDTQFVGSRIISAPPSFNIRAISGKRASAHMSMPILPKAVSKTGNSPPPENQCASKCHKKDLRTFPITAPCGPNRNAELYSLPDALSGKPTAKWKRYLRASSAKAFMT